MKTLCKLIIGICTLFMISTAYAQKPIQQGIVKTRGRMINGELIPGVGLEGAAISVDERQLVSSTDGHFSFPIDNDKFRVHSVKKNGYQLVDVDLSIRTLKYSSNPLFLVMDTEEQRRRDLLEAEKKIRRNLAHQLQEREDEIEALKVSEHEKDSLLNNLYQLQSENEKLITNMAKRYATLDYDQLDDFHRDVAFYIENGELTRADSLLRTRGDLEKQVNQILSQGKIIQSEEELLQKAKSVHLTDIEDAAQRCYSFADIFSSRHKNDSAAHYLKLRASLDTTNIEWQREAGLYLIDYLSDYKCAKRYLDRALDVALMQFEAKDIRVLELYSALGQLYYIQDKNDDALTLFKKVIDVYKKEYEHSTPEAASFYNNLGLVYQKKGTYNEALNFFLKAIDVYEEFPVYLQREGVTYYNNVGTIYAIRGEYARSLDYFVRALKVCHKHHIEYDTDIAQCYNNIGMIYRRLRQYTEALDYCKKALDIYKAVYGEQHPQIASCYNNLGIIYCDNGEFTMAKSFLEQALSIQNEVFEPTHSDIIRTIMNLGRVYLGESDYDRALYYFKNAKDSLERINPAYPGLADIYHNIGIVYYFQGKIDTSIEYLDLAFSKRSKSMKGFTPELGNYYYTLALDFAEKQDYVMAVGYALRALTIDRGFHGEFAPAVVDDLLLIGAINKKFGKISESIKTYLEALPIIGKTYGDKSEEVAKVENELASVYLEAKDYDNAMNYYKKSLKAYEKSLGPSHPTTSAVRDNIEYLQSIK